VRHIRCRTRPTVTPKCQSNTIKHLSSTKHLIPKYLHLSSYLPIYVYPLRASPFPPRCCRGATATLPPLAFSVEHMLLYFLTSVAAPAAMLASVPAQPTAEEAAAAAWLGRSVHGYCAETSNQGDCSTGSKGTWTLTRHEVRHGWLGAAVACLARCRRCQRCTTVSLSVRFTDCSWFAADTGCNTSQLHQKPSGFRSALISAATASQDTSTPATFRGVGQRSAELRSDEFDVLDRLQFGPTGKGKPITLTPQPEVSPSSNPNPSPAPNPNPNPDNPKPNQVPNAGLRRRTRCPCHCHK
jgi:hypothetical protein